MKRNKEEAVSKEEITPSLRKTLKFSLALKAIFLKEQNDKPELYGYPI